MEVEVLELKKMLKNNEVVLLDVREPYEVEICNVKGRVLAVFKILKVDADFHIFLNKSIAEKFKSHLNKYSVFYKTKIEYIDMMRGIAFLIFGILFIGITRVTTGFGILSIIVGLCNFFYRIFCDNPGEQLLD